MKFNKLKYSYSRGGVDNFDSTGNSRVFGVEPANMDDIERPYNKNIDKLRKCREIRDKIRKEIWYMYRNSEIAFGELDFDGKGYVTEKAFLESKFIKTRIKYPEE